MDGKENEAKEEREGKRKRERNESLVPAARDVNGEDGSRARADQHSRVFNFPQNRILLAL